MRKSSLHALCLGVAILSVNAATAQAQDRGGATYWNHNGSVMRLSADGPNRRVYYDSPRQGMLNEGVRSGTLLFEGTRNGDTYYGTAFIFNRNCGRVAYQVSGTVAPDDRSVTLYGEAPQMNSSCRITGYRNDRLVFVLIEARE
jgi:hypothetical protein